MDILAQSALLISAVSFALGCSVLSRNVKNVLFLSFFMLTTLISIWSATFFLEKIWIGYGFYRLHLLTNIFLAPTSLLFIRIMMRIQDPWSRILFHCSLVFATLLTVLLFLNLDTHPLIRICINFLPVLIMAQTLQLMWIDYQLRKGISKLPKIPTVGIGRRHWTYLGALIVLMISVMDHIPSFGKILPSFGNFSLSVYLFFISQAITQQRLLNFNALFSRFLVLLVIAFSLTIMYSLLVAWIVDSPALFFLNSFIASFLILMLLEPLRRLVGYFTQQLLTKTNQTLQQNLREAQRKLTGIVDLGNLFQCILNTVEQILQPEWAALFVLKSNGTKLRRVRTIGKVPDINPNTASNTSGEAHLFREVLVNHPMLQYCKDLAQNGKFPILLDQILENEIDRTTSRTQREHYVRLMDGLKALESNLLIPLYFSGTILGFVTLRVFSPPPSWSQSGGNNWGFLPMIYPYFESAAQVMQNMEVYAKQREKERLAALGEMAAGLAHEIRNPLGAIQGATELLAATVKPIENQFLNVIFEEVGRLNRIVTQFLDYSKPPTTQFQLLDLSLLVQRALERLKLGLTSPLELEFQPSRTPAWVMASSEQICQILINLVQNAQNALQQKSTPGMIRVSIGIEEVLLAHEVCLIIEDTGCGIKKENMDKLFIPFFTTSPQGNGLGLSISQKIIEAHRGRIEIISEEGHFTRVSVIFPFAKEPD